MLHDLLVWMICGPLSAAVKIFADFAGTFRGPLLLILDKLNNLCLEGPCPHFCLSQRDNTVDLDISRSRVSTNLRLSSESDQHIQRDRGKRTA